jgi:hypothetical protein
MGVVTRLKVGATNPSLTVFMFLEDLFSEKYILKF